MNVQDLPEPTILTDAEWLENLRIVMNGTINALQNDPARIVDVRNGDIGLIMHSAGIELVVREPDAVSSHAQHLVEDIAKELNRVFDESQEEE